MGKKLMQGLHSVNDGDNSISERIDIELFSVKEIEPKPYVLVINNFNKEEVIGRLPSFTCEKCPNDGLYIQRCVVCNKKKHRWQLKKRFKDLILREWIPRRNNPQYKFMRMVTITLPPRKKSDCYLTKGHLEWDALAKENQELYEDVRWNAEREEAKQELMNIVRKMTKRKFWKDNVLGNIWAYEDAYKDKGIEIKDKKTNRTIRITESDEIHPHIHMLVLCNYKDKKEWKDFFDSYGLFTDIRAVKPRLRKISYIQKTFNKNYTEVDDCLNYVLGYLQKASNGIGRCYGTSGCFYGEQ